MVRCTQILVSKVISSGTPDSFGYFIPFGFGKEFEALTNLALLFLTHTTTSAPIKVRVVSLSWSL